MAIFLAILIFFGIFWLYFGHILASTSVEGLVLMSIIKIWKTKVFGPLKPFFDQNGAIFGT